MTSKFGKPQGSKLPSYRVLVGANFPGPEKGTERRIEPDDVVDDLPQKVAEVLLKSNAIEEVE